MSMYILVLNPGSTSTKIAVYDGKEEVFTKTVQHQLQELDQCPRIIDQFSLRKTNILNALNENGIDVKDLAGVMARGGAGLHAVKSGGYLVNDLMLKRVIEGPVMEHASNLAPLIAKDIADEVGINAYIYDCVTIDEMMPIAKLSGLPEIPRVSAFHALNARAMAMQVAEEKGLAFNNSNIIVAHLGGGITICMLENGKAIDISSDDEGPFSPERSGAIAPSKLLAYVFDNEIPFKKAIKMIRGKGGVRAYLNTIDMIEVRKRIEAGDEYAALVRDAMIYQIAKFISSLAVATYGKIDAIVLTGSIARDAYIVKEITKRVEFLAEVCVKPGENEMVALAEGAYRILSGQEEAQEYLD